MKYMKQTQVMTNLVGGCSIEVPAGTSIEQPPTRLVITWVCFMYFI